MKLTYNCAWWYWVIGLGRRQHDNVLKKDGGAEVHIIMFLPKYVLCFQHSSIQEGIRVLVNVNGSGVQYFNSSTATMDVIVVGSSRVFVNWLFIDCVTCGLHVGQIYPILICLLDSDIYIAPL